MLLTQMETLAENKDNVSLEKSPQPIREFRTNINGVNIFTVLNKKLFSSVNINGKEEYFTC